MPWPQTTSYHGIPINKPESRSFGSLYIFSFFVVLSLIWIGRKVARFFAIRKVKIASGCQDPPTYSDLNDLKRLEAQAAGTGQLVPFWYEQYQRMGKTWQHDQEGHLTICTVSPANIQYVYALGHTKFEKPNHDKILERVFGRGVLLSEGAEWKRSRNLVRPTFSRYEIDNIPLFKGHVDRFMDLLPRDGIKFDVQVMLKWLFLDVASEFLFGNSFEAQLPDKRREGEEFIAAFDRVSYLADLAKIHSYLDKAIERALERTALSGDGESKSHATAAIDKDSHSRGFEGGRYILLDEMAKQIRDPVRLRGEIFQIFFPARDNTAVLVSNVLFQLARHPQHWTRLRKMALDLGPDPVYTFGTLKGLVDFQHVLYETLRTIGPGFQTKRQAIDDAVLPEGGGADGKDTVLVPKGTIVHLHRIVMHHDPQFWGSDAWDFKPERWINMRTHWEFVPFSGGPRVCPAINQAYVQATYILVRLVREFEMIENKDPVLDFGGELKSNFQSKRGVQIALWQARKV